MRTALALGPQELTLACAKAMLLVDHGETEVGELDIVFDQRVSTDNQGAVARSRSGSYAPALGRAQTADEQLHTEVREAGLEVGAEAAEMLSREDLGRSHHHRLHSRGVHHRGARSGHRGLPRPDISVEQPVHRHRPVHVLECVPRGFSLRGREVKSETGLEGVDHVLAVRDLRRGLQRDVGAHRRERRLELEQLGEGHASPRLPELGIALGAVTSLHGLDDAEQVVRSTDLLRQQVFDVVGEWKSRRDPACDAATRQAIDEVVLGHESAHP